MIKQELEVMLCYNLMLVDLKFEMIHILKEKKSKVNDVCCGVHTGLEF